MAGICLMQVEKRVYIRTRQVLPKLCKFRANVTSFVKTSKERGKAEFLFLFWYVILNAKYNQELLEHYGTVQGMYL